MSLTGFLFSGIYPLFSDLGVVVAAIICLEPKSILPKLVDAIDDTKSPILAAFTKIRLTPFDT